MMSMFKAFQWIVIVTVTILVIVSNSISNEAERVSNANPIKFVKDNPQECLESSDTCNELTRTCIGVIVEEQCLLATVPYTIINDYNKISCCFKCCIEFYLNNYNLKTTELSPTETMKVYPYYINNIIPDYRNIIFSSVITTMTLAKEAVTTIGETGNVSISQTASVATIDGKVWRKLKGRRITMMMPLLKCPLVHHVHELMTTIGHFGNPRIQKWFITQMPCNWVANRNSFGAITNALLSSYQSLRGPNVNKNTNSIPTLKPEQIESNLNLLPIGVERPAPMQDVLTDLLSNSDRIRKYKVDSKLLLECSCAVQDDPDIEPLAKQLRSQGISSCNSDTLMNIEKQSQLSKVDYRSNSDSQANYSTTIDPLQVDYNKFYREYSLLSNYKFSLSSSTSKRLSKCEWEALNLGVIPIMSAELFEYHKYADLYNGLPILKVTKEDWYKITPKYLDNLYEKQFKNLFSGSSAKNTIDSTVADNKADKLPYSASKLFLPYWLYFISADLLTGKSTARLFPSPDPSLQRDLPVCTMEGGVRPRSLRGSEELMSLDNSMRNTTEIVDLVGSEDSEISRQRKVKVQMNGGKVELDNVQRYDQLGFADRMIPETGKSGEFCQKKRKLFKHKSNSTSHRSRFPINQQDLMMEMSKSAVSTSNSFSSSEASSSGRALANKRGNMHRPMKSTKNAAIYSRSLNKTANELPLVSNVRSSLSRGAGTTTIVNTQKSNEIIGQQLRTTVTDVSTASDSVAYRQVARIKDFSVEIIVPRCCEVHSEFNWVSELLAASPMLKVSIYYKCPHCIPKSLSSLWLQEHYKHPAIVNRVKGSIQLLDDSSLMKYNSNPKSVRVRQYPNFDLIYNGKEVTAYLQHIINNYNSLSDQLIFLHSSPHAHINFEQLFRVLKWAKYCQSTINFLHLNVNYKSGLWGACCGKKSACKTSTYQYLFGNKSVVPVSIGTYSSAQFTLHKKQIQKNSKEFYTKMLLAINGTIDLPGCKTNSEGKPWGGHQLTGQYERFWHIIFGSVPIQKMHVSDTTIPRYFRNDCDNRGNGPCKGAV